MYPNIDEFTEHGQIVIGYIEPIGGVAIASEGRQTLAMLRRRKDEPFKQLLAAKLTNTLLATGRVHLNRSWTHTVLSLIKPRPSSRRPERHAYGEKGVLNE
jgi:hypothetical protein